MTSNAYMYLPNKRSMFNASEFSAMTSPSGDSFSRNPIAMIDSYTDVLSRRLENHEPETGPPWTSSTGTITGPVEDYTGYNETDGPTKVTVTANKITLTDGDRDEDYYVTSDKGAGTITDLTHWVDCNITALTDHLNSSLAPWAVSNADDDLYDIFLAAGDFIAVVAVRHDATNYKYLISASDGGTATASIGTGTIAVGTKSYVSINRASTTLIVDVYSTAALRIAGGAGDIDTVKHTIVDTAFRYVYGLASSNSGEAARDITGTAENLLLSGGSARHTESLGAELVTDGAFANTSIAAAKGVTGITKATPGIVTFNAGHGYVNGSVIFFSGLTEMTELNGEYWKLRSNIGDTFELSSEAIGAWDTASLDTSGFGAAETTGGNVAQLTDFTDWTEGVGWHPGVDGAGALTGTTDCDGEQAGVSNFTQLSIFTTGTLNKLIFTLSNSTAGTVTPFIGGVDSVGAVSIDDTYEKYAIVSGPNTTLFFVADTAFIGSIDDVTSKEVSQPSIVSMTNLGFQQGRFWFEPIINTAGALSGAVLFAQTSVVGDDGLFAYIDDTSGNFEVFKRVANVDTSLISTSVAYVPGALAVLVYDKTQGKISLFYNELAVGEPQAYTPVAGSTFSGIISTSDAADDQIDYDSISYEIAKAVTGITKANPGVVSATAHGYLDGDLVYFSGNTEMTELNGTYQMVTNKNPNDFEILDTSGYGAAETTGGNVVQKVKENI